MDDNIKAKINAHANEEAKKLGLVVLHAVFRGSPSRPIIEITLDGERPVSLSDCEVVSKSTLQLIENLVNKTVNYRLDVFSPGIDEPIIYDFQLKRSIQKPVSLKMSTEDKHTNKTGILLGFTEEYIEIQELPRSKGGHKAKSSNVITIPRSEIIEIKQEALIR